MRLKRFLLGILGIIVSGFAVYLIVEKVPIQESWIEVQKIAIWEVLLLMVVYLFSFLPRAYRWQLMLDPGIKLMSYLKGIIIGFAGNNFIPARGGELLRMEFFSRETKRSRITVLASVLTEKILDGLVLLLFLILGMLFSPTNVHTVAWLPSLVIFSSTLFLGALFSIAFLKFKRLQISSFLKKRNSYAFYNTMFGFHENIQNALGFLKLSKVTLYIINSSVLIWLIEFFVFVLALLFLEINVEIIVAGFLILSIVNFGILVPSSPAYLGVFQAMTILSLSLFHIEETTALSVGILVHFCQIVPISLLGITLLIFNLLKFKSKDSL